MNTRKNIIKNTLLFIVIFITATVLFAAAISYILDKAQVENAVTLYVPMDDVVDDSKLDWDEIGVIGGSGFVVDDNKVIRSYNESFPETIDYEKLLNLVTMGNSNESLHLVYDTNDGNKLFLKYPSDRIKNNLIFELTGTESKLKWPIITAQVAVLIGYLGIIYLIVNWLSKKINTELAAIYKAQEKEKDILFRGIAHDVKTPLAVISSNAKAINDQMIDEDSRGKYLTSIYKNAQILNERVDDLLDFSSLDQITVDMKDRDILELIRRYVGENYMYFTTNGAKIEILYDENASYITKLDEKLFNRILQNILQNSIDHNDVPIDISIDFKDNKLIFTDTGKGIGKEDADKIFHPLYTRDESRTGEKLRGMGLSNVKRICDMHDWKIYYKDGFIIEI